MIKNCCISLLIFVVCCTGCAVSNKHYNPGKKYSRQQLQQEFRLLQNILEAKHPALYWYTPKDSMNFYFDSLYNNISDSMTELQFGWNVLAPLTQKIHCGHTSFSMSNRWNKYISDKIIPSFPLHLKVWGDTMVVTHNLNQKDSIIKKGMLITSVNGIRNQQLVQKIFQYLPTDGYSDNLNYIRLSGNFPYFHRNIFGLYKNYRVGYIDSLGKEKTTLLPMFVQDTLQKKQKPNHFITLTGRAIRKERQAYYRSLKIDSSNATALITLNTFSNGGGRHLRRFIKHSFKTIHRQQLKNVILDVRGNGGGDVELSILLTKYLRHTPFKVADSSATVARSFRPYTNYISHGFFNNLLLLFATKKKKEGDYHFRYWERHWFNPKTTNHFNGKLYVLINGPSFSATTIFCNAIKGQANTILVGEETGGGWYGNNGLLIPDIVLPVTKLRVRLPFFKLVQFNHVAKNGRGIAPDIFIPPTVDGVRKGIDLKMEAAKALILLSNEELRMKN